MVSDGFSALTGVTSVLVLILVLMEYGLWPDEGQSVHQLGVYVLILVLMEYGLWLTYNEKEHGRKYVLILVLMEYGLWQGDRQC